jgi:hypothetical protein
MDALRVRDLHGCRVDHALPSLLPARISPPVRSISAPSGTHTKPGRAPYCSWPTAQSLEVQRITYAPPKNQTKGIRRISGAPPRPINGGKGKVPWGSRQDRWVSPRRGGGSRSSTVQWRPGRRGAPPPPIGRREQVDAKDNGRHQHRRRHEAETQTLDSGRRCAAGHHAPDPALPIASRVPAA